MDNTQTKYKRKIYFIDREFQTRFILKFCALVFGGGLFIMALLYIFTMQSSTVSFINSRAVVQTTASFLLPLLAQTVVIATILTSLAAIAVTLFVSHKIAGPMYRMKRVMDELSQGRVSSEFKLRHRDQLQGLAGSFNNMIASIGTRLSGMEGKAALLQGRLDAIDENALPEDKRKALNESKKAAAELNEMIRYYKL